MPDRADIIVVGGGIAGASAAAALAEDAEVLLVERETQPGFHATGRSAAFYAPFYGTECVRAISAASAEFYRAPPPAFTEVDLLRSRECLVVGDERQSQVALQLQASCPALQVLTRQEAQARVPIFRGAYPAHCLLDATGGDLDVDAILQGYLRLFRARGGRVQTDTEVTGLRRENGLWRIYCAGGELSAPVLVNAAGAWADRMAELAGLAPLGITPKRRTAILVQAPPGYDMRDWPLVVDLDENFYFKPDAGLLLLSPADETPSIPCDAQAEELDIAVAVERVQSVAALPVRRVSHAWAGLRTFAPDGEFILGEDPRSESFYWLAGQGGYGVQSAAALAAMLAAQITERPLPQAFASVGHLAGALSPERLLVR